VEVARRISRDYCCQMKYGFFVLGCLGVLVVTASCGPTSHCEGNTQVNCGDRGFGHRVCNERNPCLDKVCVQATDRLLCAADTIARPECQDVELQGKSTGYELCAGKDILYCSFGYTLSITDCKQPELCHAASAPSGRYLRCVASTTPHPACSGLGLSVGTLSVGTCDGEVAITCFDGYVQADPVPTDCAAMGKKCSNGLCVAPEVMQSNVFSPE
jgi:hypothetical protein